MKLTGSPLKKQAILTTMDENFPEYPCEIRPLSEGGGFLITYPDLPGCMSDGATFEEAVANGRDAVKSWILTAREFGDPVPPPGSGGEPGKFVQRLPKSLHTKLAARAKQEGVSLNSLVLAFIAEGLGRREQQGL
jgi:antitoxin HicB